MTNKDLIKQYVDTGILIPEYQLNQLNNNLKTTYLRKRGIASKLSPLVDYEIIMLPDDVRTKYINNLKPTWKYSNEIEDLLKDSKEPDKIIDILLSTEGFINNLNSDGGFYYLLYYSKEPDRIINILLSTEGFINKLDSKGINNLLGFSKKPDKIMNILLSTEGFINNLDSNGINNLLMYSKEPEKIMNILGNKGIEYINKLDSDGINNLLYYSKEPEKIREIIRKYRADIELNESKLKLSNLI